MASRPVMKVVSALAFSLILLTLSQPAAATDTQAQNAFKQLLIESGLRIEMPENYIDIPIQANPVLHYEHALKHNSGALEMRFIVRPLNRISIDYIDPHNAAPEPNHLFPLLFESITNQLSVGSDTPNSTFSEDAAQHTFNAHWAAASVFDVDPEFAPGYQSGFLIGMHKNHLADAYTLFLYNDHEQAKALINAALSTMSFAESMPATE